MPMTFTAYWQKLCDRNPQLSDSETKMTITAASLWRQLEAAYNAGRDSVPSSTAARPPLDDLFNFRKGTN